MGSDSKPPRTLTSRLDPRLEVSNARDLGVALCDALLARGGVHGALSPARIRLERGALVLPPADDEVSDDERAFLAPERGARKVDSRADVYSIGAILYRALLGAVPFERATDQLPAELRAIVLRSLHKEPERRYADVHELRAALKGESLAGAALERPRGRHLWLWALVLVLLAGAAGAGWWWWQRGRPRASAVAADDGGQLTTAADAGLRDASADARAALPSPIADDPGGVVIASLELTGPGAASDEVGDRAAALRAALAERLRAYGLDVLEGEGLRPLMAPGPRTRELSLRLQVGAATAEPAFTVEATLSGGGGLFAPETVLDADCEAGLDRLVKVIASGFDPAPTRTGPEPTPGVSLAAWGKLLAARALAEQGEDEAAEALLAELPKRTDEPPIVWLELAEVRTRMGLDAQAREALTQLGARATVNEGAWFAARFEALGQRRRANLEGALRRWPYDHALSRAFVRRVAFQDGDLDAALAELERVRRLDSARPWLLHEGIELALAAGDRDGARAQALRAAADRRTPTAWLRVAELELEAGETGAARKALAEAVPGASQSELAYGAGLGVFANFLDKRYCKSPVQDLVRLHRQQLPSLTLSRRLTEVTVQLSLHCSDTYEVAAAIDRHAARAPADALLRPLSAQLALVRGDVARARKLLESTAQSSSSSSSTGRPRLDRARRIAIWSQALTASPPPKQLPDLGRPLAGDRSSFLYEPPLEGFAALMLARGDHEGAELAYQEVVGANRWAWSARMGLAGARAAAGDRKGGLEILKKLVSELDMSDEDFLPLKRARRALRELAASPER